MITSLTAQDAILKHGLMCRCPRCGKGRLFNGFLTLARRCEACGLDYSFANPADGPAFFVMTIMAIPAMALGVWIELTYEPSLWVHVVTTLPFLLLTCIPPIRPTKGMFVASQYFSQGRGGAFRDPGTGGEDQPEPPGSRRFGPLIRQSLPAQSRHMFGRKRQRSTPPAAG
jgi:uncharacterized protein (DUF983 family)